MEDSKCVFKGVRFSVHVTKVRGKNGKLIERDMVIHPGAVVILPILDEQNILLIRNERFAVGETLWELPAGTLEPKEKPYHTAARELIEETGYKAEKMNHLNTFYTTPGFCNEIMHAYVATELTFVGQKLDETEKIQVEIKSWKDVLSMIREGIIRDGKTIATLLYYSTYFK